MTESAGVPLRADDQLTRAIAASEWLSDAVRTHLSEHANVNVRGRFALAYLSIALDHREAILLLVKAGAYSSAYALIRSQVEAYILALWVEAVAKDDFFAMDRTSMQRSIPKFETAYQGVRKHHQMAKVIEPLRRHYSTLSDFSHGHLQQISRWISENGVSPDYLAEDTAKILHFSDIVATLAAMSRESIIKDDVSDIAGILTLVKTKAYQELTNGPTHSNPHKRVQS